MAGFHDGHTSHLGGDINVSPSFVWTENELRISICPPCSSVSFKKKNEFCLFVLF